MERLGWQTLLTVSAVAGVISAIGLRWWTSRGFHPIPVPLAHVLMIAVLAGIVLVLGLRIRRYIRRAEPLDPIGATRTLVLGQAAALAGAIHVGYFGAQLALALPRVSAPDPRAQAWLAAAAILTSLMVVGAGLITQWCCLVPPDDDERS